MNMDIKEIRPYLNVIAALCVAFFFLAFTVDVNVSGQAGIRMALPAELGTWQGDEMRFCQNRACQAEFYLSELDGRDACPRCGSRLDTISFIEASVLPEDTEMLKVRYERPTGHGVFVSIVLSGGARDSIHRPQLCLTGQGFTILDSYVIQVPIEGRDDLGVMVLETTHTRRTRDGRQIEFPGYYAYWFVGSGRETPYHTTRMIWMGLDRVLYNVAHRWAYIAVAGHRHPDSDEHMDEITSFIQKLYPAMVLEDAS